VDKVCCIGVGLPFVGTGGVFTNIFAFYPFVEGLGGLVGWWLAGIGVCAGCVLVVGCVWVVACVVDGDVGI
jgi:hypothetical protein